jgi:1,4-dihydroxy-6-naphthoate synthase
VEVRLAHTPDADDAFMFYAIVRGKVPTGGLVVRHVYEEIESLNQRALAARPEERYELTALSAHAYAFLRERYELLAAGGSFGLGWGPVLVAPGPLTAEELGDGRGRRIAVPGKLTTAALLVRLRFPAAQLVALPFREVLPAVRAGTAAAGVLIHEEQLTFAESGMRKVLDFGAWWTAETGGLPLPLGVDAVRRDLAPEVRGALARLLGASIAWALAHRAEALDYALGFSPRIDRARGDRFVGMYVNELTADCGERGRAALAELYRHAAAAGVIPEARARTADTLAGRAEKHCGGGT